MKVLFVSSGNNKGFSMMPFIAEQAESLKNNGIEVLYFPIIGKGISGYLESALKLRKYLRINRPDLIHAHFTLSGWVSVLATRKTPIVLSLMGDDAYGTYIGINKVKWSSRMLTLLTLLIQPFVKAIISKSQNIEKYVYLKNKSYIIPNGVNTDRFYEFPKSLTNVPVKQTILFLGNKSEVRKNFSLVQSAVNILNNKEVDLLNPYPLAHSEVPALLNSAAVLALPSLMEGSPNIVKEAMACNCPVVATNTGDVKWVVGDTPGCYVSSFNVHEFAAKLKLALKYAGEKGRTNGAQRLLDLGLDDESTAIKIIAIYKNVLGKTKNEVVYA